MTKKNIFYAQSGGVTAVINATACAVIETARKYQQRLGKVLAGRNGIVGALSEELFDTSLESDEVIAALRSTPGGAFGSCRYKLKSPVEQPEVYQRLMNVFTAHDIGAFLYNGGGDSLDTANKLQQYAGDVGYPLQVVGIPKTVDNDLMGTDSCPGFGSVAKYVAVSMREAALDVASMAATSTKVFIMEVMGRHTGWIAAAAGLAQDATAVPPVVILLPERPFSEKAFLARVRAQVAQHGYCTVAVSEGIRNESGEFLSEADSKDAFGHVQLGGVAPAIAALLKDRLGLKCHWAVADYLQRSARHIASEVDLAHAYAVGEAAIDMVLAGRSAVLPVIARDEEAGGYSWRIGEMPLSESANLEKPLPDHYISEDGFGITEAGIAYLKPLIQGEAFTPYKDGLPDYRPLKNQLVPAKLPAFDF